MKKTTSDPQLNIGIIGLGAIGCLISSQLPNCHTIFALPRSSQIQSFSFQLNSEGDHHGYHWPVWQGEVLDVVIVCCKASQCQQALLQWQSAISPTTQVVLLQNGLGQHDALAKAHPQYTIFAASTTEGAYREQPNKVVHAGIGQTQWGFYAGTEQALKLPLASLKGNHLWSDNIQQVLLDKLAVNALINPLTVKYQCKNGELLTRPDALADLKALAQETEHLFKQLNWKLSHKLFEKAQLVAQLTANNISSMLQDVNNKRTTEIDFINGYLVNKAAENRIILPLSQSLINLVKSYEPEKKVC